MSFIDTMDNRLQSYRPVLDRMIFGLSLVGVLVVTHIFIQQSRGFDQGCLGFSTLEPSGWAFDCEAVVASQAAQFLGLSNITWGFGFYLLVAALTVAIFWARPALRRWLQGTRTVLLTGGLLYSGYLVYVQGGLIGAFCTLCLASAVLTALLFGAQVLALATSPSTTDISMSSRFLKREIVFYTYLVALTAVLVGADFTYFNTVKEARSGVAARMGADAPPQCQLDATKEPVENDGASLVRFQDVVEGASDADVTVVEYFDPNCPHCRTFHETMKVLMDEYEEEVRFVFKPFPLRASSLPEIQALYVAQQEDKFSEMLEGQYERQGQGDLTEQDLRAIAEEIDMNPDDLMSRIQENEFREQVVQQRQRAIQIGVDSTPTVLVNGHFVQSRSQECMETFIEQAQEGTLGS